MHNIFFPVETIARELDYRLLLAAKVLKKNQRIYICHHRHLDKIMKHFRGGVYVGKHILPRLSAVENWNQYKKVKRLGIDVIYIHEEGAIFGGSPDNWKKILSVQYDPKGFDQNDRLCVWGKWQKSVHEEQNLAVPIRVTGHPRFDLCKEHYRTFYKDQVDQLRKKYTDFILVNGNYGSSNNGIGVELIFSLSQGYNPNDPEARHKFVDFYAHSTKSMVDMISLVHRLSTAFPEKTLVYRSHPSEGDHLYKHVFNGLDNVKIIHEGSVGPWLLAAETIIHDGCTTAIEASFASAHIINYKQHDDQEIGIRLPNLVGTKATTPERVIELIQKREIPPISGVALNELGAMIDNYYSDSFERLSDVIEETLKTSHSEPTKSPSTTLLKYEYVKHAFNQNKKKWTSRKKKKAMQYNEKKFPGFDLNSIQDQVSNAAQVMGSKMELVYANPLVLVLEGQN